MPHLTLDVGMEEIKALALQLAPAELLALADALQQQAETVAMMRLAETGFHEWDEEGEDIYDDA